MGGMHYERGAVPANPIRHWFIAFHERPPQFWSEKWFTRKGMVHVTAAGYSAILQTWVFYNVHANGTWIEVMSDSHGDLPGRLETQFSGCRVLKIKARPSRRFIFRPFFTCVEAVKHLTGVRSSAWTPRGLYDDMLKAGATPAFEDIYGIGTGRKPGTAQSADSSGAPSAS